MSDTIIPNDTSMIEVFSNGEYTKGDGWTTIEDESLPSKKLQTLYILSTKGDTLYKQNPIIDSLWIVEKKLIWGEQAFDYEYTLEYPVSK